MWETLNSITTVNQVNVNKDERFLSMVGGSVLLLYALIRIPFSAVLALIAAVYLFFRSIRGFCYIYDQLGQNTAVNLSSLEGQSNGVTAVVEPTPSPQPVN